jgi:hypothetical protein
MTFLKTETFGSSNVKMESKDGIKKTKEFVDVPTILPITEP